MREMYPYGNGTFYTDEGILRILAGLFAAVLICVLMVRLTLFVFRSLSLYKIARRRGIRGAWLAWVPVACDWIVGSVADQYQYVVKGRIKNRRLPVLLLGIAVTALQTVTTIAGISLLTAYIRMMVGEMPSGVFAPTLLAFLVPVLVWIGSVAYLVIRCIAVYDLYSSCTTRYNVLYLVLGLVFQFLEPIFFFICRNKEEGMPPRRETAASYESEPWTEEQ